MLSLFNMVDNSNYVLDHKYVPSIRIREPIINKSQTIIKLLNESLSSINQIFYFAGRARVVLIK